MGGGASSQGGDIAAENERLKKEIDAAVKRAEDAERAQQEASSKKSEIEQRNAELSELAKNFGASNERAKALAQQELVNMAKVWRAQRAVDECKGIKEVSQARLEFWSDALSTAAAKRKDFEFGRSEAAKTSLEASQDVQASAKAEEAAREKLQEAEAAAQEALRVAEESRKREEEVFRSSFNCDSFLAAAETAIEETTQAEQHAQELIAKREAELQGVQEALQKATEKLQQLQSHKQEKMQEKARLENEKEVKKGELQEAGVARTAAEEALKEAEGQVESAKKLLMEANKDLEHKMGMEQGLTVKQRTLQTFVAEAEQIEQTTNQEVVNSQERSVRAQEALVIAEQLLTEQNQESKQLEVKLREEAAKGDMNASIDAAAIAAARALLELVPFKDPSQTVPQATAAPSVFSVAYKDHRLEESKQREVAQAAGITTAEATVEDAPEAPKEEAALEAAPQAAEGEGEAEKKEE